MSYEEMKKTPLKLPLEKGRNPKVKDSPVKDNNIKGSDSCQPQKTLETEIAERFTPKKKKSLVLADSYRRLDQESKAERVADCGSFLEFGVPILEDGQVSDSGKLQNANFCRDRLCPMCAWRRSYKIFGQVSRVMDQIGGKYKFLFLTLTIPNCSGEELPAALDKLMTAFKKLMKYKRMKVVKGFFRALEITKNKSSNTFHPHFHCILAVPLSYGKKEYIKHSEWLDLWRKACNDYSITQVDIRVIKDKNGNQVAGEFTKQMQAAIAEVTKYTLKDSDFLDADDPHETDYNVTILSGALYHRRLVAYGGCFKDVFDQLQMDDPENGDLVHLDQTPNEAVSMMIVRYGWTAGCYKILSAQVEVSEQEAEILG